VYDWCAVFCLLFIRGWSGDSHGVYKFATRKGTRSEGGMGKLGPVVRC